jgi:tRNA threonylcarbamoyladenosine biosynthesis protein TsaB
MLLAIDTSTSFSGIACYGQEGLLGECVWQSERNHTAQLLPQLDMLFQHIERVPADIEAIGVALGPGSWSGIRVGISIAKGLASAGGLRIIGISTLDVLAYQHRQADTLICPIIRLGRGRFATARFQYQDAWKRVSDYRSASLVELCIGLKDEVLFCGDVTSEVREQLTLELGEYALFPDDVTNVRRPSYLAHMAWQRYSANDEDNIVQLEPLYLGEPVKMQG